MAKICDFNKMNYREKLKHPRWLETRDRILKRDKFTCQECKMKKKILHVHHVTNRGRDAHPWDYPDDELQTLCQDCHWEHHENRSGGTRRA